MPIHDPHSLARPPILPNEIIISIIQNVVPSNHAAITIPPSDPITKTLVSLAVTSRLAYHTAIPFLYSHCLYINSFDRLEKLHRTLYAHSSDSLQAKRLPASKNLQLPLHSHTTSLLLDPFPNNYITSTEEISSICKLLQILAPTLKRLVLSIPSRSTADGYEDWSDNFLAGSGLYDTLARMTSIEVFCSTYINSGLCHYGEQYSSLGRSELPWEHWPNLRVLALNALSITSIHLKWMSSRARLERLVLVAAGSSQWRMGRGAMGDGIDLKYCYEAGRRENETEVELLCGVNGEECGQELAGRKQELCWVDVAEALVIRPPFVGEETWNAEDRLQVRVFEVLQPKKDSEPHYIKCCRWTREKFVLGDEVFLGPILE